MQNSVAVEISDNGSNVNAATLSEYPPPAQISPEADVTAASSMFSGDTQRSFEPWLCTTRMAILNLFAWIIKIIVIVIPPMNTGIWTLEKSMSTWTLRFMDEKIEHSYQWSVNKRYLLSNRRFTWFMVVLTAGLALYHWLVETSNRIFYYIPLHIFMLSLMLACVAFSYLCVRDGFYVYKYHHQVLSFFLFAYSFTWMVGQPLILSLLRDPLLLDPTHTLLIFFIYNLAITNLRLALISTTLVVVSQGIVCGVGTYLTTHSGSRVLLYLTNDFLSLVLAYLFAYMCARVKEMYMRQIYLVRYFQKEEATLLHTSRLKMQIVDDGMKVLRSRDSVDRIEVPKIQRPRIVSLRTATLRTSSSDSNLGRRVPLFHVNSTNNLADGHGISFCAGAGGSFGSRRPLSHVLEIMNKRNLRPTVSLTALEAQQSLMQRGSTQSLVSSWIDVASQSIPEEPEVDDCLEDATSDMTTEQESIFATRISDVERTDLTVEKQRLQSMPSSTMDDNIFLAILHELPQWLLQLPLALQSSSRRHSLWLRIVGFVKYKVCMYAGDENIEKGFQEYFNPLSICRFKLLAMSAVFGGVLISLVNYLLADYVFFEMMLRLVYIPSIALLAYFAVCVKSVSSNPKRTQAVILLGVYFIFVGYLMLVFDANSELLNAYSRLDPVSDLPSLIFPSNTDDPTLRTLGSLKSPFDTYRRNETHYSDAIDTEKLLQSYLYAEAHYIIQLNAMTLFCCFAASSSGLRLVTFMMWKLLVIVTLSVAAVYSTLLTGFDGQRVRTVLVTTAVAVAGVWIVRPLESEMRKWYHLKQNFGL